MKIRKIYSLLSCVLILLIAFATFTDAKEGGKGKNLRKTTDKAGEGFRMNINNIDLPLDRSGILADVQLPGNDANPKGGVLDNHVFLFSGGFFMSGQTNGTPWANAVASASRIQDYVAGTYASGPNDSKAQLYVVAARDGDFAQSWLDWKDAVALGANFYDGDGDGIYNPVDKNHNGKWDPDEDRPDLIGDEVAWCVYSDNVDPALRSFNDVEPQGIEIRQSVFAFNSKGTTGNMVFVRYEIMNTGLKADVLDSVYFGVWADPDLGEPTDDLVGCDTLLNAGFVYNSPKAPDKQYGSNPPAFLIDFFQGPIAYIPGETFIDANGNGIYDAGETALDSAIDVKGQVRGKTIIPGAKNLGLSSFVHYQQSDPTLGDPANQFEARYYMTARNRVGLYLNPCTWQLGTVSGGVNCAAVDNKYWYSGDPVTNVGWINTTAADQRLMLNTGAFKLEKGKPVTIIAGYVAGRGSSALQSVDIAKKNDIVAQTLFDNNFPSPPPPPPVKYTTQTGDGFIDINFKVADQLNYNAIDTVQGINKIVEGFYVTQYKQNLKASSVGGNSNAEVVARYDLNDRIQNIYAGASNGGVDLRMPVANNQLDSLVYRDTAQSLIKVRLTSDMFGGGPFIKGKDYYYTITEYAVNQNAIVERTSKKFGPTGDYLDASASAVDEYETQMIDVPYGVNMYNPVTENGSGGKVSGFADGDVKYVVVDQSKLTGDNYKVEFYKDSSSSMYSTFYKLLNSTKNTVLIDSSKDYTYDTTSYAGVQKEGFLIKVKPVTPAYGTPTYSNPDNKWFKTFLPTEYGGVYYVGKDLPQSTTNALRPLNSTVMTADQLRDVEIRFGTPGKAYRYINGVKGSAAQLKNFAYYAGGFTAADTVGKGVIGKLGEGYVDVPFTAWIKDAKYGEEKQLSVGFIERTKKLGGIPDGEWNPTDSLARTAEILMIFNTPYTTEPQTMYTGVTGNWADAFNGYKAGTIADLTPEQVAIAGSPWFNSMYLVGLNRKSNDTWFNNGEILKIPMATYPYTTMDIYSFTTKPQGELSSGEKKNLFEKINVFPNPLFAYNPATSYNGGNPDEPFVTFSNLPEKVTVKIYTLSGTLIRTLTTADKSSPSSPFLRWNLQNEDGLRIASGMYLATLDCPGYGKKVLKFAVIMPQKQIQTY